MPLFTVPDDADSAGLDILNLDEKALRSRERIRVKVLNNSEDASSAVANEIAALIRQKTSEGKIPFLTQDLRHDRVYSTGWSLESRVL